MVKIRRGPSRLYQLPWLGGLVGPDCFLESREQQFPGEWVSRFGRRTSLENSVPHRKNSKALPVFRVLVQAEQSFFEILFVYSLTIPTRVVW